MVDTCITRDVVSTDTGAKVLIDLHPQRLATDCVKEWHLPELVVRELFSVHGGTFRQNLGAEALLYIRMRRQHVEDVSEYPRCCIHRRKDNRPRSFR